MMRDRARRFFWFLVFVYPPIMYVGLYEPVIVPRLPGWRSIPMWVTLGTLVPYCVLLLGIGFISSPRQVVLGSLAVAVFLSVLHYLGGRAGMPTLHKALEDPWWAFWLIQLAFRACVLMLVMSIGTYAGNLRRRRE